MDYDALADKILNEKMKRRKHGRSLQPQGGREKVAEGLGR